MFRRTVKKEKEEKSEKKNEGTLLSPSPTSPQSTNGDGVIGPSSASATGASGDGAGASGAQNGLSLSLTRLLTHQFFLPSLSLPFSVKVL